MKKLALIISFVAFIAAFCTAQKVRYKELDAEITALNKFEESRLQILSVLDEINSVIVEMFEYKDGSKPRVFTVEFYTDDAGYRRFDEELESFGHIEKKSAGLKMNLYSGDSVALKMQISQNDSLVSQIAERLLFDDIDYDKLFSYRARLLEENERLYQILVRMRVSARLPNRIKIRISS